MKIKLLTTFLFAFIALAFKADDLTQDLKEAKIKMDLPNDSWSLADKKNERNMAVYIYKRQPIEDAEGRQIIPNIAVIIEDVEKDLDVIAYTALKRSKVSFEVLKVYTHHEGQIAYENAIGYKGKYTDKGGLDHTIYVLHGINGRKGFQLICDVTTNIHDKVEAEFFSTLKSIRK